LVVPTGVLAATSDHSITCIYTQPSTGKLLSSNLSETPPAPTVVHRGTCISLKPTGFHQFTNPCLYVCAPAWLLYNHGWTYHRTGSK